MKLTLADKNCPLYTKEPDGTIQKWFLYDWVGPAFSVFPFKNAKPRDFKNSFHRFYHMDDVGKTIFLTMKEASAFTPPV